MVNTPVLSICIPCFKRLEQVRNTLKSIYEDNSDVGFSLFEVVISDNDPDCELRRVIDEFCDKENLRYIPTKCEGFMNSYYALTYGEGELLKLHNSQAMIKKGMLAKMIKQVQTYKISKPLIYTSNGLLGNFKVRDFDQFDDYMSALSYWSSWSGGMTIWREDFERIGTIDIDPLFPHTSVMLTQYDKRAYVISDLIYYDVQRIKKRGGHNKFEAFTRHYPALINQSWTEGHINVNTKNKIYRGIYREFLPALLFNKYISKIETYSASGYKNNCRIYFPKYAYWESWLNVLFVPLRIVVRKIKIKIREIE